MPDKPAPTDDRSNIESVLHEDRKFECPEPFRKQALINSLEDYERIYRESVEQPEKFWGGIANELHWFRKWDKVLEWNHPWAKWFVGGQLNISYNCLDRHVQTFRKNKAALIWESEPGEVRTFTYQQLHREVQKFANVLKSLGCEKGRPGCHLHGDDARAAHRHAGLRPHRRPTHGGLRWIFVQCTGGPHSRFAGRGCGYPGRFLPPGC